MEVINLNEYDVSYDIQYMKFMVKLLAPYIHFKVRKSKVNIYRNVEYRKDPLWKVGDRPHFEIINLNQYIEFIQCDFPRIIQSNIKKSEEDFSYEECKQDLLLDERDRAPYFKLPIFNFYYPFIPSIKIIRFFWQ